jgi:hypothetical protein
MLDQGNSAQARAYLKENRDHLPELIKSYEQTQRNLERGEGNYDPKYVAQDFKQRVAQEMKLVNQVMRELKIA